MSAGRFNLSALAVRERSVTLFLIILISVAGLVAFFGLGRAEDPPFTVKQMTVITVWPGATAQEMQDQVAEPLEKRLQELKWYDRTETYTRPGMALITLALQDQTPPSEVPEQFYQARKKLGDVCEITLSLVGRNLWMLYCKAPFDPETIATTGNFYQGIDYFMMPSLRNIGFNLRLKF